LKEGSRSFRWTTAGANPYFLTSIMRSLPRTSLIPIMLLSSLVGCGAAEVGGDVTARRSALTMALSPSADTFINSANPDNNNGTSPSIYTGENGQNGLMRGLLKFALPAGLQGQAVTRVTLTLVTRGTGLTETAPPTAATASLRAITVPWVEGAGFGDGTMTNTVGQACGTTGATWNQPNCTGGDASAWSGGAVIAAVSATAMVPATLGASVTWDSSVAGNAAMLADVQSWIDAPDTNQGWEISSSTEGNSGQAQRFYSREATGQGASLTLTLGADGGASDASQPHDAGGAADAADASPSTSDGSPGTGGGGGGGGGSGGCGCSLGDRAPGGSGAAFLAIVFVASACARRGRRRSSDRHVQK
jgi:hypothetical protein